MRLVVTLVVTGLLVAGSASAWPAPVVDVGPLGPFAALTATVRDSSGADPVRTTERLARGVVATAHDALPTDAAAALRLSGAGATVQDVLALKAAADAAVAGDVTRLTPFTGGDAMARAEQRFGVAGYLLGTARDGVTTAKAFTAARAFSPQHDAALTTLEERIAFADRVARLDAYAAARAVVGDAVAPRTTDGLAAALARLDAAAAHAPSDSETRDRANLDRLPGVLQDALATLLDAHVGQMVARDHDARLAARAVVLDATLHLVPLLTCVPGVRSTVSPVFNYDFTCTRTVYFLDSLVLVDAGGNDDYYNNAGGGDGAAGLLVDWSGNDRYFTSRTASRAVTGSGFEGAGFLFDGGGSDVYRGAGVEFAAHGSAFEGVGFLFDGGGSDTYDATVVRFGATVGSALVACDSTLSVALHCQSGGARATGGLVDAGGNDRYSSVFTGESCAPPRPATCNGYGAAHGSAYFYSQGTLVDLSGADTYAVTGRSATVANGGASHQGRALLVDGGGADTYAVDGALAANGAATGSCRNRLSLVPDSACRVAGERLVGGPALLFDASGNDVYVATAVDHAANGAGTHAGVAALVDGGGADAFSADFDVVIPGYTTSAHGAGGLGGVGFLFDAEGDDVYAATARMKHGSGSYGGLGVLVDGAGNDHYGAATAEGFRAGSGLLFDAVGDDVYGASRNGYGYSTGTGLLVDGAGSDVYGSLATTTAAVAAGVLYGHGYVVDAAGDDAYYSTGTSGNGGAWESCSGSSICTEVDVQSTSGFLVDGAGNDHYEANGGATAIASGAAVGRGSVAAVFDATGDDTHVVTARSLVVANGAGYADGVGVLWDGTGNDAFTATAPAGVANGAGSAGSGALFALAGANTFTATIPDGVAAGAAQTRTIFQFGFELLNVDVDVRVRSPAVGLLVAGAGDDEYRATGTVMGAGSSYAVGLLVDLGGSNLYVAGPGSFAQGAGATFGVGLLSDHGTDSQFTLGAGAIGQGAGLQGVGMLLRTHPDGLTRYNVAATGVPGVTTGAGTGTRLDAGDVLEFGVTPDFSCGAAVPIAVTGVMLGSQAVVCGPDDANKDPIVHPVTGEPVADAQKPSGLCSATPCGGVISDLFGPTARQWLDSPKHSATTSGGYLHVAGRDAGTGVPYNKVRLYKASVDETCDMSCAVLGRTLA